MEVLLDDSGRDSCHGLRILGKSWAWNLHSTCQVLVNHKIEKYSYITGMIRHTLWKWKACLDRSGTHACTISCNFTVASLTIHGSWSTLNCSIYSHLWVKRASSESPWEWGSHRMGSHGSVYWRRQETWCKGSPGKILLCGGWHPLKFREGGKGGEREREQV